MLMQIVITALGFSRTEHGRIRSFWVSLTAWYSCLRASLAGLAVRLEQSLPIRHRTCCGSREATAQ